MNLYISLIILIFFFNLSSLEYFKIRLFFVFNNRLLKIESKVTSSRTLFLKKIEERCNKNFDINLGQTHSGNARSEEANNSRSRNKKWHKSWKILPYEISGR